MPLKILMISRQAQGGMREHLLNLLKGLAPLGHNITLVSPLSNLPKLDGVEYYHLPIPTWPLSPLGIKTVKILSDLIKDQDYQIVHTHGYVAGILGRLSALSKRAAQIHSIHNYFPTGTMAKTAVKYAEIGLAYHTTRIIVVSNHLKTHLADSGLPLEKLVTIYNGIAKDKFSSPDKKRAREKVQVPANYFLLGTISRLIPAKGVDTFLKALALIKGDIPIFKALIIGDGPLRLSLLKLSHKLGLAESVIFLGHRNDIPEILPALDLFVLASRSEGFGISILEAQLCGVAVIAASTGGINEIIENKKNGLLFSGGERELANYILSYVNNPGSKDKMIKAAQEKIDRFYTIDKMIEQTLQVYYDSLQTALPYESSRRLPIS